MKQNKPDVLNCRIYILSLIVCALTVVEAQAQIMPDKPGPDSLIHAFVPVISYTSNEGLMGGIIYNRYDYRGEAEPFHNYVESSALISTKGFIQISGTYERTRTFGWNIRSTSELFLQRYTMDNYFGIGNSTMFDKDLWEEEYYYFETLSFGIDYQVRKPLFERELRRFDLTAGVGSEYQIPYSRGDQTLYAQQPPNGREGGWVNYLSTGFIWENRDSEFDPTRGNRAEFRFRFSPELISKYGLASFSIELRQYFQLLDRLKIANRLEARHTAGDVPYWEMSTLGDDYTLRGYPLNRFLGRSSVAYTLELRSWILQFPDYYGLKFGGHLFTDTGRVFTSEDDISDLFAEYKQTFGIGGAVSAFSPDFIIRGSLGFSEELTRIYIGVGYMF